MNHKKAIYLLVFSSFILISTIIVISVLTIQILKNTSEMPLGNEMTRSNHILVGGTFSDSSFVRQIYEGACEAAEKYDAVVELLLPSSEADDVSLQYWLDYAAAVDADGIILCTSDENVVVQSPVNVSGLVIPLVTTGTDNSESSHVSFIGINAYDLGQTLASVISSLKPFPSNLLTVIDSSKGSLDANRILASMYEALGGRTVVKTEVLDVNGKSGSADEIIRQTIINSPETNIIFCYSNADTLRVAQSVVNLNKAGKIAIVGLNPDKKVLEYMQKGIVSAVVSYEPKKIGEQAVKEIFAYHKFGYANGYILNDVKILESGDIDEYF